MDYKKQFGVFISEKRKDQSYSISELAGLLGITKAYLSQLENGIRCNPSSALLLLLSKELHLDSENTAIMYRLYSKASGRVSPDIAEYVLNNACVEYAIRLALDKNAGEQEWMKFVEILNDRS